MERGDHSHSTTFTDMLDCQLLSWAPDGVFLACTTSKHEILIRNAKDQMAILQIFHFTEHIDKLEWSRDSNFLAVGSLKSGILRIFNIEDSSWNCTIEVGTELECMGLKTFSWNQNRKNLQLITTDSECVQLTIWSLMRKDYRSVRYIKDILPIEENKSYSPNGSQIAVGQYNSHGKYFIGIYDTSNWSQNTSFRCDSTFFNGLKWNPNGSSILVWESPLLSNLYVYSPSGELLKHYSPDGLSLGVEVVDWSPTGQILAFTNHSNKLRLLNGLTYGLLLEHSFRHNTDTQIEYPESVIYREESVQKFGSPRRNRYIRGDAKIISSEQTPNPIKKYSKEKDSSTNVENPKTKIKFSWDGSYLATWTEAIPKELMIWNIEKVKLAAILKQKSNIMDFGWSPDRNKLCFCTSTPSIYFWSERSGASIKTIPEEEDFSAVSVNWNGNGDLITVAGKDRFTVCCPGRS